MYNKAFVYEWTGLSSKYVFDWAHIWKLFDRPCEKTLYPVLKKVAYEFTFDTVFINHFVTWSNWYAEFYIIYVLTILTLIIFFKLKF